MRGAKPKLQNVIPMRSDDENRQRDRQAAIARTVRRLLPRELKGELRTEFRRVAQLLAAPTVDRLKPHYIDTIVEYCRSTCRLRSIRDSMPTLNHEIYRVETRNGLQVKNHPYVGQLNETWRQWRSLVAMLGLSPTDERNLLPGQGDLFDEDDEFA